MKQNKNSKTPQLPVKRPDNPMVKVSKHSNPLDISEKLQHFKNRDEVRKFLPDIKIINLELSHQSSIFSIVLIRKTRLKSMFLMA